MRTSTTITSAEKNAYDQFCAINQIINDETSAASIKNGELIGNYICRTWNEDIKQETLEVALEKLKDQLAFVPVEQVEVTAILAKLSQSQRDTVANWIARQNRLIGDGLQGFSNVSTVVGWLQARNFEVTDANLTTALGNCQNNGKRRLFWKEPAKQDRSIGPGGKVNHSIVNKSEEGFMPKSQTNRTWRQVVEDNRVKETPVEPIAVNPEYRSKAEGLVGRTHGQTDQARKLFIMVPGTTTIDWQQTLAARTKFLSTQAPLVRR